MKRIASTIKSRTKLDISMTREIQTLTIDKFKKIKKSKSSEDLYVPTLPFFCPITKSLRDNEKVREVLVFDSSNQKPPRLSWYNPNDDMIPINWFVDGVYADLQYYFED